MGQRGTTLILALKNLYSGIGLNADTDSSDKAVCLSPPPVLIAGEKAKTVIEYFALLNDYRLKNISPKYIESLSDIEPVIVSKSGKHLASIAHWCHSLNHPYRYLSEEHKMAALAECLEKSPNIYGEPAFVGEPVTPQTSEIKPVVVHKKEPETKECEPVQLSLF